MTARKIWIGSVGPINYDDAGSFKDGTTFGLKSDRVPADDEDVLRLVDTGVGGAAAPSDASYIVIALDGVLSAERRLQAGTGLTLTDGGANGDVTINHDPEVAEADLTDNTGGTANDTLENLADGTTYANDHAAIENNFADLAAKVNAILQILRNTNLLST